MRFRSLFSVFPVSAAMVVVSLSFLAPRLMAAQSAGGTSDGIDPATSRVDARSGVSLCWNSDEAIFPRAKEFEMSATPLSEEERERSLKVVDEALHRYPADLLKQD